MNKIDVIIDALSVAQNSVWSALNQEALAYAIELKTELEPVGEIRSVVWGGMAWTVCFISHKKLNLKTKLYALGEERST
jgi:hypothetical protein